MTDIVLECRKLDKHYAVGPQRLQVLDQVDLILRHGKRQANVERADCLACACLHLLYRQLAPAGDRSSSLHQTFYGQYRG